MTGLGRTGRWFAFEHTEVVPDIVVTSKALGGGVPAAAVITSREIAAAALAKGFVQSASHQGDPFQCAVALANLDVMETEDLPGNAERMGRRLMDGLRELTARHRLAGDARGIGLIAGLEIVDSDKDGGGETPELAAAVSVACLERGLIVGGLRPGIREGNTLRLAPPLTVSAQEIDEALTILDSALTDVAAASMAGARQ